MLPLVNSTGDPANEYFSDGMSEEFISFALAFAASSRSSGGPRRFSSKARRTTARPIGEKLGVYYLLEGSVRKSADRVRIAVALVKAGDGSNVWSETYDRELKDIFAVQSEIAGAVAKQLKVALLGTNGQSAQLTTAATPSNQNVEAYNALLQGNFYSIAVPPTIPAKRSATTRRRSGSTRVTRSPMRSSRSRRGSGQQLQQYSPKEGEEAIAKGRASEAALSWIRISPKRIPHKA